MSLSRRRFITRAAPAIVRASSLMKVSVRPDLFAYFAFPQIQHLTNDGAFTVPPPLNSMTLLDALIELRKSMRSVSGLSIKPTKIIVSPEWWTLHG